MLRTILAGLLVRDPANRRNGTDQKKIAKLNANWHWPSCGTLEVVDNGDGTYGVIEGWHRACTILQRFGPERPVPCNVLSGLSTEDKLTVFLNVNKKKPISSLEEFHARAARGDDDAVEILDIIAKNGLTLARYPGDTASIKNARGLEEIFKAGGTARLNLVFAIATATWPSSPLYYRSALRGLAAFVEKYPDANMERLVTKLEAYGSQLKLENAARDRMTTSGKNSGRFTAATVVVLVDLYNSYLKESSIQFLR